MVWSIFGFPWQTLASRFDELDLTHFWAPYFPKQVKAWLSQRFIIFFCACACVCVRVCVLWHPPKGRQTGYGSRTNFFLQESRWPEWLCCCFSRRPPVRLCGGNMISGFENEGFLLENLVLTPENIRFNDRDIMINQRIWGYIFSQTRMEPK